MFSTQTSYSQAAIGEESEEHRSLREKGDYAGLLELAKRQQAEFQPAIEEARRKWVAEMAARAADDHNNDADNGDDDFFDDDDDGFFDEIMSRLEDEPDVSAELKDAMSLMDAARKRAFDKKNALECSKK
jgi:hypothetical protein